MKATTDRMPFSEIQRLVRAGDRVTFYRPAGKSIGAGGMIVQDYKEATGTVVMHAAGGVGFVLNMGGRFGTPAVVDEENFISATIPKDREPVDRFSFSA